MALQSEGIERIYLYLIIKCRKGQKGGVRNKKGHETVPSSGTSGLEDASLKTFLLCNKTIERYGFNLAYL